MLRSETTAKPSNVNASRNSDPPRSRAGIQSSSINQIGKSCAGDNACVFCGERGAEILHDLPHVWHQPPDSGEIRVRWCGGCEVGFVNPVPDEARLSRLYGASYFKNYGTQRYGARPSGWRAWAWRLLTHLAWRMDRSCTVSADFLGRFVEPGARVCDLGCGPGHLLEDLRAHGYVTCGVEPDPAAVDLCRSHGLEVWPGTAEALPTQIRDRRFDAVVLTQVLEHCRDPLAALRAAVSLLRPGGHLVVEVPNAGSLVARALGATWFHADVGRHLYFFTSKSVASLAERAGAHVVDTIFSDYTSQFLPDRMLAERQVWEALGGGTASASSSYPRRPSLLQRGTLLARTAVAPRQEKYGVMALVARVPVPPL